MKKEVLECENSKSLRQRALDLMHQKPQSITDLPKKEIAELVQELGVYQIELEMQNEELRRAQAELENSRRRYSDLYDFAPVGYFVLDKDGVILDVNLTGTTFLGVEKSRMIGKRLSSYINREDQDKYFLFRRKVLETYARQSCEIKFKTDTGVIYALLLAEAVKDTLTGDIQCRMAVTNITERKRAEETMRESEMKLRAIIESTADGILAVDNKGKVLQSNRRFSELWRIPRPLMEGGDDRALLDFVLGQLTDPDAFLEKVQLLYGSDAVDMDTVSFKDGRFFERYSCAMTLDGARIGRVWSFRDITERNRAEEILKRDQKTLRKMVEERSGRLMKIREELERSKRLADIGTLAATVAHELRNPLAGISLATAVIKRKTADDVIGRQLEGIDNMVAESGQIIDNLLFYSRLRPKHRKTVNVHSILEECIDTLRHVRIGKNIMISKHIDSLKDVPICADPVQIREVFANILNNAADAVSDHGGEIEVKARVCRELIEIHMTNNGRGIAKEDLKKVFDPFFTTKARGTGLGLTVSMQIVKMHGGSINIKDRDGEGTSFIISLPRGEPKGEIKSAVHI